MKNIIFLILTLILLPTTIMGQYIDPASRKQVDSIEVHKNQKKEKKKKEESPWLRGGNFSLQFLPFAIDISPTLAYRISPKFQLGIGLSYMYNRQEQGDSVLHLSIYGGRFQLQPRISKYLFLQAEYEVLNVNNRETLDNKRDRLWLHNPQLGVGLRYSLATSLSLNIGILYNFNYASENSPFPSPWRFRIGFNL